jgi:tetratricopeptide (TPR) repeat protein
MEISDESLRQYESAQALLTQGADDLALLHLQLALDLAPDFIEAGLAAAQLYRQRQALTEAESILQQILAVDVAHVDTLMALADLYLAQHNDLEATQWLTQATRQPNAPVRAWIQLAQLRVRQGYPGPALQCLIEALAIHSEEASLWEALSQLLQQQGHLELSIDTLMQLMPLYPERRASLSTLLGDLLAQEGEAEAADNCYQDALTSSPTPQPWLKLRKALLLPGLCPPSEEAQTWGQRWSQALNQTAPPQPPEALLPLWHSYSRLKAWKALPPEAGAPFLTLLQRLHRPPVYPQTSPPRHGVLLLNSAQECELVRPWLTSLPLTWVATTAVAGAQTLPNDVPQALQALRDLQPDVVLIPNPTGSPVSLAAALTRIAPWQVGGGLSPGTESLPGLDALLGPEGLPLPSWAPVPALERSLLGLPSEGRIYLCLQPLDWMPPAFDALIASLLQDDPSAQMVLITRPATTLRQRLLERLRGPYAELLPRIWFLPPVTAADEPALVAMADALLDVPCGGGLSPWIGLQQGTPLLTWAGSHFGPLLTTWGLGAWVAPSYAEIRDCVAHLPSRTHLQTLLLAADTPQWPDLAAWLCSE